MYPATDNEPFLKQAGYKDTWEEMTTSELGDFFQDQAMYHVHNTGPNAAVSGVCKSGRLVCHGSCFVNELPAAELASMKLLINKTKAADKDKSVIVYSHSMISAETGAATKYADSIITNSAGEQVTYIRCAKGSDYPLFFATSGNSYGAQMMAYYRKALDIGFTGVYHECERNDIVSASLSHNSALRAVSFVDLRPRIPTANGTASVACLTQRRRRCFTSSGRSA